MLSQSDAILLSRLQDLRTAIVTAQEAFRVANIAAIEAGIPLRVIERAGGYSAAQLSRMTRHAA